MTRAFVLALAVCLFVASAAAGGVDDSHPMLLNENPVSGTLTGNRAGAFAYYTINYPGDLRVVTIELEFAPADPVTRLGVGLNVYGPGGYLLGQTGQLPDTVEESVAVCYSDDKEAVWLVQVYNYIPNHTVSYSVLAKGLPEVTAVSPAPTPTPSDTQPPASLQTPVAGSMLGHAAGAYHFYEFSYPGDGSEVTVRVTYTPDNDLIAQGVGFVVYGPTGRVARGEGTGKPTQRQATFSSDVPGSYLIQVYNYIEGLTIDYEIHLGT
jgi:hypothetical protein